MSRPTSQLALSLPALRRWGGRRPGAGRKPGPHPGLPHASREMFRQPLPAHVTLRLRPDLPSLRTVRVVREIERSFAVGCVRPGFRLVHYSLQGNHAHLIVEARDRHALGCGMMAISSRLARAVNRHRVVGRAGRVSLDPASSARWFDGWKWRPRDDSPAPLARSSVARARTWLLKLGWRR